MFKVIYCLVSDETDYYYEQLILSLLSLRKYNERINVTVLVDESTHQTFVNSRTEIFQLVDEVQVVAAPAEYNKKRRSRFLKTTAREQVKGDYLFVDTDTVVCCPFPESISYKSVAAVKDLHITMDERHLDWTYVERMKQIGYEAQYNGIHFNSGIIWVRDDPVAHNFYRKWNELWTKDLKYHDNDQPAFNEANRRMRGIVEELDGIWNCQPANMEKAILYLARAVILHYYGSSVVKGRSIYDLCNIEVLQEFRNGNRQTALEVINAPRSAFTKSHILNLNNTQVSILESQTYLALSRIYISANGLFNLIEKTLTLIHKMKFKRKWKSRK